MKLRDYHRSPTRWNDLRIFDQDSWGPPSRTGDSAFHLDVRAKREVPEFGATLAELLQRAAGELTSLAGSANPIDLQHCFISKSVFGLGVKRSSVVFGVDARGNDSSSLESNMPGNHRASGHQTFAPAKINLFLEVYGSRPDRYHDLATVMVCVSLYDTLRLEISPQSRQLEFRLHDARPRELRERPFVGGERASVPAASIPAASIPAASLPAASIPTASIPAGTGNLVLRAVELLRREAGDLPGGTLTLVKRIPHAAGLGGGSSDAAAMLRLGNRAWKLGIDRRRLGALAAELGSDVPFFLGDGPALCEGRGERVGPKLPCPVTDVVLACPPVALATAEVFRELDLLSDNLPSSERLTPGEVDWGSFRRVPGRALHNRLRPVAARLTPWIDRLVDRFNRLGVIGAGMSGSGSTCFAICRSAAEARHLAAKVRQRGVWTCRVRTLTDSGWMSRECS